MVGRPIRPQLAERLPDVPSLLDRPGGSAHAQLKFDGVRVQLHLDRRLSGESTASRIVEDG